MSYDPTKNPFSPFVGKKVKLALMGGYEAKGVMSKETYDYVIVDGDVIAKRHIIILRALNGGGESDRAEEHPEPDRVRQT